MHRPSDLRQFLEGLGISPKKSLSQNFLIDGNIIQKIVGSASVTSQDVILEIGPGPGALTQALLERKASVIAIEKDNTLAHALTRLSGNLEVHNEDALTFPIEQTISASLKNNQKAKVIANLPYHLTTPLLILLAPMHTLFSSLTLMVQDEVAKRMSASPGSKEYGSLTVFLNYYSNVHYAFKVGKRSFYPVPKVDSAIVQLFLRPPPKVSDEAKFFELTRGAFQQRRKMLRSSLSTLYPKQAIENALLQIFGNTTKRPEELSLEQFILLFESLRKI